MPQNLPRNDFKWVEEISQFNEDFVKLYNEDSNIGYFIEAIVQYPEKLHDFHDYVPFLHEGMKIEKIGKIVANLHGKGEYINHINRSFWKSYGKCEKK